MKIKQARHIQKKWRFDVDLIQEAIYPFVEAGRTKIYLWENILLRPTAGGSRIFVYASHDTCWHLCEIFWPVIGGMSVGLWNGVSITFVDKIIWISDSERRAQLCN